MNVSIQGHDTALNFIRIEHLGSMISLTDRQNIPSQTQNITIEWQNINIL